MAGLARRAVIVSTARTGLAKSYRGGFNATHGASMGGHVVRACIDKAGIDAAAVDDVIFGCGMPEGETGMNIGRNIALSAGCPVTTSGTTINRFCSSGLQAVASAAHSIIVDSVPVAVGGGIDSISLVQPKMVKGVVVDKALYKKYPAIWMPMIETADIVAHRYGVCCRAGAGLSPPPPNCPLRLPASLAEPRAPLSAPPFVPASHRVVRYPCVVPPLLLSGEPRATGRVQSGVAEADGCSSGRRAL